jgi:1A family penicillin-binding protein
MDSVLIKIFATALTLSQVTTAPDGVKTHFDRETDQQQVVQLLQAGCAHMRKAFEIEDLKLDDLITTALDDPQAVTGEITAFRGINFADLNTAYRQFCKNETVEKSAVDIGQVIDFYNQAAADLPDHMRLKGLKLPGTSTILDGNGRRFADVFGHGQRRVWLPIADIPEQVQKAFVAAEDKRFYEHKGVDERGLIRAFISNLAHSGRPQGGSTITQQVVKNLLVGEDLTYERKIREMIVASRVEHALSKSEILELYLNTVYLGRGAWGIETAARSYFGKPAKELSLGQAALLAGMTKGPSYFSPDRHPEQAQERYAYVLTRMQEDGAIGADAAKQTASALPALIAYEPPRRDTGFYFVDQVAREVKTAAGLDPTTADSYTIHSTIDPQLQRATEAALQEGLARYEINAGRARFQSAEANLSEAIQRLQAKQSAAKADGRPAWQQALQSARLPLYDVHWLPGLVMERTGGKKSSEGLRVGLPDGRILPLSGASGAVERKLKVNDVIYVQVTEGKSRTGARAALRVRPQVQGTALMLENKTGRILAMAGGFSYALSQFNRASQAQRQPGSAIKPLTYLAALQRGLQPNTLVRDEPITLPPIGGGIGRDRDYWSPRNYDSLSGGGIITLRHALENSRNLATVNLLDGGIESNPEASLDRICGLALEAQIYRDCVHYYPFVLGAQPVRPIDLAAFFAAVANEGLRPSPYAIASIEQDGKEIYRHPTQSTVAIGSADRVSFYQLKTMLQGVVQRGTAHSIAAIGPYVAGKTGTSDDENDTWFVGFTNDVTVAVWVGYDNAEGRRTLGGGSTGGSVAAPIFRSIVEAAWSNGIPKTPLAPPSPEARSQMVARTIDLASGEPIAGRGEGRAFTEYFRADGGEARDTQYRIISRDEAYAAREYGDDPSDGGFPSFFSPRGFQIWPGTPQRQDNGGLFGSGPATPPQGGFWRQGQFFRQAPPPPRSPQPQYRDPYRDPYEGPGPQRIDPGYIWGNRRYN